jgi:predicted DNA-binding protein (UPF0251 family)
MKLIIIFFITLFTISVTPQERQSMKRVDELEKIRLLEALNLDEKTAAKFMVRRSEHKANMRTLHREIEKKLSLIDEKLKANASPDELKRERLEYFSMEEKLSSQRKLFFDSLNDFLTEEQILNVLLFERSFREEIRDVLIKNRGKRRSGRD